MPQEPPSSTALALPAAPSQLLKANVPLSDDVRRVVEALKRTARSPATLRAYQDDWRRFTEWCSQNGQRAFPTSEDTIIAFLATLGMQMRPATLRRQVATIRVLHREWGEPLQTLYGVQKALENIARERARLDMPNKIQKRGLGAEEVIEATLRLPKTLVGLRDRAVLLFGWAIGQRRADIAALRVQDVRPFEGGLYVTIRKSKTNQSGKKPHTPVVIREGGPGCPVAALEAWLKAASIESGPLIRRIHKSGVVDRRALSGHSIAVIVKQAAKQLGKDPREYGGHSLRRGFTTSADRAGKTHSQIMMQTGHRTLQSLQDYIESSPNPEHAAVRGLLATDEGRLQARETIEVRGQTLVKAPKRRFERDGDAYDARSKVNTLKAKGFSLEQIASALSKLGVTWAGRPVEARDL